MAIKKISHSPVKELRKKAFAGDPQAQFELGWCCYSGSGVHVNYEAAASWWSRAAAQGHRQAHFDLHVMFHKKEDGVYTPVMPL